MRIVRTTDGRYLGLEIEALNSGDTLELAGFIFEAQFVKSLENGNTLFSNPNYQIECEEL